MSLKMLKEQFEWPFRLISTIDKITIGPRYLVSKQVKESSSPSLSVKRNSRAGRRLIIA